MTSVETVMNAVGGIVLGLCALLPFLVSYALMYEPRLLSVPPEYFVHTFAFLITLLVLEVLLLKWQVRTLERNQKCKVCNDVMGE